MPTAVLFYFDWIDADPTPLFGTNIAAALDERDGGGAEGRPSRRGSSSSSSPTARLALLGPSSSACLVTARAGLPGELHRHRHWGSAVAIPVRSAGGQETLLRDDARRAGDDAVRRRDAPTDRRRHRRPCGPLRRPARSSGGRLPEITGGERRLIGWRTSTERRDLYPALLAWRRWRAQPCGYCSDD